MLLCLGLVSSPPPTPTPSIEKGPGKPCPPAEPRPPPARPPDARKDLDLPPVFQGKPRGLSEAAGRGWC